MSARSFAIPVELIDIPANALRGAKTDEEDFKQLQESLRANGLISAITVRPNPEEEGRYLLLDGVQRFTAAKGLGWTEIDARVRDDVNTEDDALIMSIVANAARVDTKPVEYARAISQYLSRNPLVSKSELAAKMGMSSSWLDSRLRLTELVPEVATLVDEGKIIISNAVHLAKLSEEEQVEFALQAQTSSPADFGELIRAHQAEKRKAARNGETKPAGFTPALKHRSIAEISDMINSRESATAHVAALQVADPVDAFLTGVAWAASFDALSQEEQRQNYETAKAQRQAAAERRKSEREAKRNEDAQRVLDDAGI